MLVAGYVIADEKKRPLVTIFCLGRRTAKPTSKPTKYMLTRLANIPEGEITETFIHPSLECDELKGITSLWHAEFIGAQTFLRSQNTPASESTA